MYIEGYRAGEGAKYYYRVKDGKKVIAHIGTAETILKKLRPELWERWRSEEKTENNPRSPTEDTTTTPPPKEEVKP